MMPDLEIRPGFENPRLSAGSAEVSTQSVSSSMLKWRPKQSTVGAVIDYNAQADPPRWSAWNPDALSRTVFETFSICMLLYDAFLMPYRLAWNVQNDNFTFGTWTTRIFWTFDLLLNLVTGYRLRSGLPELRLGPAMRRYLRTWFLPDLVLVCCDWLVVFGVSAWMRWVRVMRLVRGGRQVLRAWSLVLKAKLMVPVKAIHLALDISMLLLLILWLNHVASCGWIFIGRYAESDTGYTWLSKQEYPEAGERYEYLTALHWAITQITPGSMEVVPENSTERFYTVSTLFLGLLLGSSLIATLTSMMTQYKLRIENTSKKFMELHKFLHQQGVEPKLALAINLQVRMRSREKERLKAKDVDYLSLVSTSLREALWHGWCMRFLSQHAFFNALEHLDQVAMQCLCNTAIKAQECPASEAVFETGTRDDCMYFVVHGQLQYLPGESAPEANLLDGDPGLVLNPGDWCSEPALWTLWTHLGSLEAALTSEVLSLNGPSLQLLLRRFPPLGAALVDYCHTFHKYINESGVTKSDLRHKIDINELISGLSPATRLELATPVVQKLEPRFWGINQRSLELLKEEVSAGKCDIGLVGQEPVRNTFVIALRIRRHVEERDEFLVQVGEVLKEFTSSGKIAASCLLPGVKRKSGENYPTALNRLLERDLCEISSQVEIQFQEGCEQSVLLRPSPTLGIRTRYLRTTFEAVLKNSDRLCTVPAPSAPTFRPGTALSRLFSPAAHARSAVQEKAVAVLADQARITMLHCGEANPASRKLYLWLTQDEFEALSHEMAKPVIQQWAAAAEDQQQERLSELAGGDLPT